MSWKAEPIKAGTVEEAIEVFFRSDPFFTPNRNNEQLYGHDFLHALLSAKFDSDTAEEIVAIYQSVLLGRANVATSIPPADWRDYGPPPALDDVVAVTVPGARTFVNETVERLKREHTLDAATLEKFSHRHPLNREEIEAHYEKALILRKLVEEKLGRPLGAVPVRELGGMDFGSFQALLPRMESMHALTAGRSQAAGYRPDTKGKISV